MIAPKEYKEIMPYARLSDIAKLALCLDQTMTEFFIDENVLRECAFVAQIAVESGGLASMCENLNYSREGLLSTFPKYFNAEEATEYARQPERIANRVYANRMGNGDEESGDGWQFKGRGLVQLTGRSNYQQYADYKQMSLVEVIDYLQTPEGAANVSGWYWYTRDCNAYADAGDFKRITRAINGGLNGYAERVAYHERAKRVLA